MEDETLDKFRHTFQKILTPIVVVIGVLGNLLSVVVLSSRRMRCSTNVYLTALAVTDIIFLCVIFSLSLKHYQSLHESKYEFYWKCYGIQTWICDAATYTSFYLVVSFTLERYIAVCHPIRGQVLCTESRAKRVIAVVAIVCLTLTASTAFEWQVRTETKYYNKLTGVECIEIHRNESQFHNVNTTNIFEDTITPFQLMNTSNTSLEFLNDTNLAFINKSSENDFENRCEPKRLLFAEFSEFGLNNTYKEIFFTFTSIFFIIVPLILLATFNWFLVAAVHRSRRLRHTMTNTRQGDSSTSQENKITIILIAVVLLFLVCQTPTALFLIYSSWIKPEVVDRYTDNALKALGNVLNFLVAMNAAFNFVLYCVLSDQYRKTVAELFCRKKVNRQNSSRYKPKVKNVKTIKSNDKNENVVSSSDVVSSVTESSILDNKKRDKKKPQIVISRKARLPTPPEEIPLNTSGGSPSTLQRSQSLNFKPPIKHSPDCKSNTNNL